MLTPEIEQWECGDCGEMVSVRHFLQRNGKIVHDPEAAYREAIGLDKPEGKVSDSDQANG